MVNRCIIVWTKRSQQHMREAFEYISNDSPKNASRVLDDIIEAANKAIPNPEIYAADKNKINNDGSYRAFVKHHYRVSYRITKNIIRILRVRHTSREPELY